MAKRPGNGKVTTTVRRLLALEAGQRQLTKEVGGINARLDVLTEHVIAQGHTLERLAGVMEEQGRTLGRIETLLGQGLTR